MEGKNKRLKLALEDSGKLVDMLLGILPACSGKAALEGVTKAGFTFELGVEKGRGDRAKAAIQAHAATVVSEMKAAAMDVDDPAEQHQVEGLGAGGPANEEEAEGEAEEEEDEEEEEDDDFE